MNAPLNTVLMVRATAADIACVAAKMRPDEQQQWSALTGRVYDADSATRMAIQVGGHAWALVDGSGRPFLVGGFHVDRPGVANVWLMGTMDGWEKHWRQITKICRRSIAAMIDSEFHRVEVTSLASRTEAGKWYARIGLTHTEPQAAWFADGSDAVTYAAIGARP